MNLQELSPTTSTMDVDEMAAYNRIFESLTEAKVLVEQKRIEEDISPPASADLNKKPRPEGRG